MKKDLRLTIVFYFNLVLATLHKENNILFFTFISVAFLSLASQWYKLIKEQIRRNNEK